MPRRLAALLAAVLGLVGAAVAVVVVVGRGDDDPGPTPSRIATDRECEEARPAPPVPKLAVGALVLRPVAEADQPTAAVFAADGSGNGFLAERPGRVRRVTAGQVTDEVVLDLRGDTMQEGDGGLLALALSPAGDWLYVYRADVDRDDVVTAYPIAVDGAVDDDAAHVILTVDHPDSLQHHGGAMVVGSDGLLYVGLGDGGGLGDPRENAEDETTLLGKVLRIEPTPGDVEPYRIPPDNPFVDDPRARPEIWVLGVRNPFRMGQDAETGDLWLGDVGQSCWEELDRLPTGADGAGGSNLGWDHREGNHPFEGGAVPGRQLDPFHEQAHGDGWCGIVAGYVPRASAVPVLDGRLLFTDYCKGKVLALAVGEVASSRDRVIDTRLDVDAPIAIVAGPSGRPWILSLDGTVWEVTSELSGGGAAG